MLTGDAQRSTGVMVRPYRVAAHSINVDAIQEPVQLLARQLDDGLLPSWPYEVVFFEAPQHTYALGGGISQVMRIQC